MAKVQFLQDFGGRETKELFFKKGEVWECDNETAARLVSDGRAEEVKAVEEKLKGKKVKDE